MIDEKYFTASYSSIPANTITIAISSLVPRDYIGIVLNSLSETNAMNYLPERDFHRQMIQRLSGFDWEKFIRYFDDKFQGEKIVLLGHEPGLIKSHRRIVADVLGDARGTIVTEWGFDVAECKRYDMLRSIHELTKKPGTTAKKKNIVESEFILPTIEEDFFT